MKKLLLPFLLIGALSASASESIVDNFNLKSPFIINVFASEIEDMRECSYYKSESSDLYYSTVVLTKQHEFDTITFEVVFPESESTYDEENGQCEKFMNVFEKALYRKYISGEEIKMNVTIQQNDNEDLKYRDASFNFVKAVVE